MKFMPKTKIGKWSFWLAILGLVLMYSSYWIAIGFGISIPPVIGLLSIVFMLISGITSAVSIIKYKDRAISLFISLLIGLFAIFLILGEFLFISLLIGLFAIFLILGEFLLPH